jgi:hypothetical protein
MHFDDRLATVLRQSAASGTIVRIQYRQLLDLLGTIPHDANGPSVDAAYDRLAQLSEKIPAEERAAILREPWMRLRSPRLIAVLSDNELPVADAAIAKAQLSEEEWLDLAPALPLKARGFLRNRHDLGPEVERLKERMGVLSRGLPPVDLILQEPAEEDELLVPSPLAAPIHPPQFHAPEPERVQGIGAIVRRIEEFRKARNLVDGAVPSIDSPRLPLDEPLSCTAASVVRSFDFSTDNEGRITWSTPSVAPMLVGLRITADDIGGTFGASPGFIAGLRRRQPLRQEHVSIVAAPAVSGEWLVDASPRFDRGSGRFTGYIGRMRRPAADTANLEPTQAASEADRMRQLLHELRTPVNAIQGFAEVIQQQLFGPTPHEYRALAASIVGDAARILAGFEDLDRLAKLEGRAMQLDAGAADLAQLLTEAVNRIEPFSAPRKSGFAMRIDDEPLAVAMDRRDAERLVWRLLATLASSAEPGEMLKLRARAVNGMARVSMQLPAALASRSDDELFSASVTTTAQPLSAGIFGGGFALRLSASEARSLGGGLQRHEDRLRLLLPLAPAPELPGYSWDDEEARDG